MSRELKANPFVPYDPNVYLYVTSEGGAGVPPGVGGVHPYEYSGWWDEMLSYYDSCYIHAGLNPAAIYKISGPNAKAFLNKYLTNSFAKFPVGMGKHGIMCNKDGNIIKDGVLLRTGEQEYLSYWLWPHIEYAIKDSGMDVQGENLSGKIFFYQLAGPKCLDLLEEAAGENLKDIKFFYFRDAKIAGKDVFILRIGMAGSLAYEVHGKAEDALDIYNYLLEVGKKYKLKQLGRHAYRNTHTEGGFPQNSIHFCGVTLDDGYPEFSKDLIHGGAPGVFPGSAGPEKEPLHVRNPIELGWTKAVSFDHDFIGKEALQKLAENPTSQPVTLIWNQDDIFDVWKSVFEEGEPYKLMPLCEDVNPHIGSSSITTNRVMLGETMIGISSGRMFSPKKRVMISLGQIKPEYCEIGKEVVIVWGDPGKRQKEIRATIQKWPYDNGIQRNENISFVK